MLEIRRIQQEARKSGKPTRPRWPMIVLRTPKGWTGPKEVDGHKVEGFWRSHQVPLSGHARQPGAHEAAGRVAPQLQARGAVRRERPADRRAAERWPPRARGGWAPTRTPTAGCCASRCGMPDFRNYGVKVEKPGTASSGEHARRWASSSATSCGRTRRTSASSARTKLASNRLGAVYEASKKLWLADYLPEDADGGELAPDGRVLEMLSEHTLEGWLEGVPADRPPRLLLDLRGVRPRHRLDVQHAREVAGDLPRAAVARTGLVAEPADHLDGLAAGPQRLHPPGPRLPRRRVQQEPRRLPHLPAAGREHAAERRRPLPAEHRTTSTSSSATSRSTSST